MIRTLFWISVGVVIIGTICNFSVIAANDWQMPMDAGHNFTPHRGSGFFKQITICPVNSQTRLVALADIYLLEIGDDQHFFSVGDIFLLGGFALALVFGTAYFWMLEIAKEAKRLIRDGPQPIRVPFE